MFCRNILLICSLLSGAVTAAELCAPPQLSTQAEGMVEAVPDLVIVDVTVSAVAPTLSEAKLRVDTVGAAVLKAGDQSGVQREDILASRIQAAPDYDWNNGQRILRGQSVSRQFELKLRNVERYGTLVQALADADVTQINGIRTEFSRQTQLEHEALQQAIANVQAKAKSMAAAFGRRVDGVISVNEGGGAGPEPYELRARTITTTSQPAPAGAELSVGKRKIVKSVAATFRLDGGCATR